VDVVTASATAFVHGRPARRRCAAIVVLPLQARYTNHGWLTPAAPDARRRCTEKTIFAVHNRMFPRAAGVNPPWLAIRTLCRKNQRIASRRCDPQTEAAGINPPCFANYAADGDSTASSDAWRVPDTLCEKFLRTELSSLDSRGLPAWGFCSRCTLVFRGGLEFDPPDQDERGYGIVHVWDLKERRLAAQYRVSHERVISLALSPDGKLLAVSDTAGRLQVFPLPDQFSKTQR